MGIHGLLPFLKPYVKRRNIKELSGNTVGIDAMCWMHKGAFACSKELLLGVDTHKFVYFFLRHIELLRFYQIKPVVVFDGARLPAKAREEANRGDTRAKARDEALELVRQQERGEPVDQGKLDRACEAAIKVTSDMIARLQSALRELAVHFIVAPYEADAQLAYMCRIGWVHAVITEDSDLLAYGCPNTFFKMDKFGDGQCIELPCHQLGHVPEEAAAAAIDDAGAGADSDANQGPDAAGNAKEITDGASNNGGADTATGAVRKGRGRGCGGRPLRRGRGGSDAPPPAQSETGGECGTTGEVVRAKPTRQAQALDRRTEEDSTIQAQMRRWNAERFAEFCVLCGSDYKEPDIHIKGFGIKTAFRLLCRFGSVQKMLTWMGREKRWKDHLPCESGELFVRFTNIVAVFWHHIVFDPGRGQCLSIANAFPHSDRELPGVDIAALVGVSGTKVDAAAAAMGEVDPRTGEPRLYEKLTDGERSALERIIAQKRVDQREFNYEQQRREDASRIEEARAAAANATATLGSGPAGPWDVGGTEASVPVAAGAPAEAEEDNPEELPRPLPQFLKGDMDAIMGMVDSAREHAESAEAYDTPPKVPPRSLGPAGGGEPASQRPASNPFARKRPSLGCSPSPADAGVAVLAKRPRNYFGSGSVASDMRSDCQTANPADAHWMKAPMSQADDDSQRKILAPVNRPRGGHSANDAAFSVLASMGVHQLQPQPETKDRGKLTSFFGARPSAQAPEASKPEPAKDSGAGRRRGAPQVALCRRYARGECVHSAKNCKFSHAGETVAPIAAGGSKLASWRARPWEEEPETAQEAPQRSLSMDDRSRFNLFKKKW